MNQSTLTIWACGLAKTGAFDVAKCSMTASSKPRPRSAWGQMYRILRLLTVCLICPCPGAALGDQTFFDDGAVALVARELPNVVEPPVPIFHNGARVDDPETPEADLYQVVEIFDRVPETTSFPLTWSDLVANTFIRPTYQTTGGATASLGTSLVGSPSLRLPGGTPADFLFLPEVDEARVSTGGADRIAIVVDARFLAMALVTSTRAYRDPQVGRTETDLSVRFEATAAIALDSATLGSDAFRLLTVSSMWSDAATYDANVIRFEDETGQTRIVRTDTIDGRGRHIWPSADGLGSWLELVKEPGSDWFPDSPSIRVEILETRGVAGRLGIQGFLAETQDPNDDSFMVWIEWIDAPPTIPEGSVIEADFLILASAPTLVPATSPTPTPTPTPTAEGADANCDGAVSAADLTAISQLTPESASSPCGSGDANDDRQVDGLDLLATVSRFRQS